MSKPPVIFKIVPWACTNVLLMCINLALWAITGRLGEKP